MTRRHKIFLLGMMSAVAALFGTPILAQEIPVSDILCAPDDDACLAKRFECPSELDEDACATYRSGQVKAARAEAISAEAGEDRVVLVGDTVQFSSAESEIPDFLDASGEVEYWWNFGDFSEAQSGPLTGHTYAKEGEYTVTLVIKTAQGEYADTATVMVVNKALFLIVGESQDAIQLTNLLNQARRLDFLVYTLTVEEDGNDFAVEERLMSALFDRIGEIRRSDVIIGLTKNSVEINALLRLGNRLETSSLFVDKSVVIASENTGLLGRRVQPISDTLQSKNVLIVAPSLLEQVIEGARNDTLIEAVQSAGKDFVLLGVHSRRNLSKLAFYNVLSHFVNSLINLGVSINTILLLLMLPVVATIIAFARQIVGIKSFGVYIPTILTLTFVAIGVYAGLLIIVVILGVGTLTRLLLRKLRLLYLPRMALVITVVSIAILGLFFLSVRIPHLSLLSVSVFPILILIMLVEEFIKVQIEEGARGALIVTFETIGLSVIAFFMVNGSFARNFLLSYPEIILISFVLNFALGKWTGLRLWEYYRFREVLKAMKLIEKK